MSDNREISLRCLATDMNPAPGWALLALRRSDGKYSCPYHWHDRATFSECSAFKCDNLSRLSEHVREKHLQSRFFCTTCGTGTGSPRYQKRHTKAACKKRIQQAMQNDTFEPAQDRITRMQDFSAISKEMIDGGHHVRSYIMDDLDSLLIRLMGRCKTYHDCCPAMRDYSTTVSFGVNHAPPRSIQVGTDVEELSSQASNVQSHGSLDVTVASVNCKYPSPPRRESYLEYWRPQTLPCNFAPAPEVVLSRAQNAAELIFSKHTFDLGQQQPILLSAPSLTWVGKTIDPTNLGSVGGDQDQNFEFFYGIPASEPSELSHTGGLGSMDFDVEEIVHDIQASESKFWMLEELGAVNETMTDVSTRPAAILAVQEVDTAFGLFDYGNYYDGASGIDPSLLLYSRIED